VEKPEKRHRSTGVDMGKDSDEPWRQGGLLLPPETISNATWLVATKLRPPVVRDDVIRRPKLERAVAESVRSLPLTLLSAPAGYGKTTMLALLPRLVPEQPVAWVTLDTEDNDPVVS
jgi:LuxR family maltose regulon positive regulatory protein